MMTIEGLLFFFCNQPSVQSASNIMYSSRSGVELIVLSRRVEEEKVMCPAESLRSYKTLL